MRRVRRKKRRRVQAGKTKILQQSGASYFGGVFVLTAPRARGGGSSVLHRSVSSVLHRRALIGI
jgi:hypothetical protein